MRNELIHNERRKGSSEQGMGFCCSLFLLLGGGWLLAVASDQHRRTTLEAGAAAAGNQEKREQRGTESTCVCVSVCRCGVSNKYRGGARCRCSKRKFSKIHMGHGFPSHPHSSSHSSSHSPSRSSCLVCVLRMVGIRMVHRSP